MSECPELDTEESEVDDGAYDPYYDDHFDCGCCTCCGCDCDLYDEDFEDEGEND